MHRLLHPHTRHGFSLLEVMISLGLISYLMIVLFTATDAGGRAWRDGQARTDAFQSARTTLEIMAREVSGAVVDTRMQMVVAPAETLEDAGAPHVAPNSPVLLWVAPLGEESALRTVGYYLYRNPARRWYRLKRIFISPEGADGKPSPYFPRIAGARDPGNPEQIISVTDRDALAPSPVDARWFTQGWNAAAFAEEIESGGGTPSTPGQEIVSTVADNVVAFWVQSFDILGQPIPLLSADDYHKHPKSNLLFNSAAYFQMASAKPFAKDVSFLYLAKTPQSMRANRVPAAMEFTLVTLDAKTIARHGELPVQPQLPRADGPLKGTLDVEASHREFIKALEDQGIYTARTFSSRTRLINGN